jgi:hypothetical protein
MCTNQLAKMGILNGKFFQGIIGKSAKRLLAALCDNLHRRSL